MGKVLIIAEAGVNHNGNMEMAKQLVLEAKKAGADAVKFQTFKAELVMSRYAEKAEYQKAATGEDESQIEMVRKFELPYSAFEVLRKLCEDVGIAFLSTPFDLESVDFLAGMGLQTLKIPSGEITNLPYLTKIGKLFHRVILSTGMSTLPEIGSAMDILKKNGAQEIVLLHCNTEYPTPYADVNLRAMQTMKEKFGVPVGYSDHTLGIEIPVAAVAMGASVIEKHFTLNKTLEGPDHKASLEPQELAAMVRSIRNVEAAMGSGEKVPSPSEIKNMVIARKSIVAAADIQKGEAFTEWNLTIKRPGSGISPMRLYEVIGQTAGRDYKEDELIVP
jgi:N,N'-diacetyllegionaminate synthase